MSGKVLAVGVLAAGVWYFAAASRPASEAQGVRFDYENDEQGWVALPKASSARLSVVSDADAGGRGRALEVRYRARRGKVVGIRHAARRWEAQASGCA